jgi:quinol-cytochrome oxidoreductase complex cytochrome b subunit
MGRERVKIAVWDSQILLAFNVSHGFFSHHPFIRLDVIKWMAGRKSIANLSMSVVEFQGVEMS